MRCFVHRRLLPALLLLMTSAAHAGWLHACPAGHAVEGAPAAVVTQPDGRTARFIVNERASLDGCRGVPLGVAADQVQALYPLPPHVAVDDVLLVQGAQRDGRFIVGDVVVPPARPASTPLPATPMPMHQNLLAGMRAQAYGVEERVQVRLSGSTLHVACHAGTRPAGVILSGPWTVPKARAGLQLEFSGDGSFPLQAADAAQAAREEASSLGPLDAHPARQAMRLPLPDTFDRGHWKQYSIACPMTQATLQLDALMLVPVAGAPVPRSTWIWKPEQWRRDGGALLDWARGLGIRTLFVSIPVADGEVRDAAALAGFISRASTMGIAVWSVDGDPHMVLPDQQPVTVQRARAYVRYNAGVRPPARLQGMQFDVEPYLLPGHALATDEWDRRYLQLARSLHQAAGSTPLEFVVPYWWGDRTALLDALAPLADGLAVMDYRTDPRQVYGFAAPFLDWATTHRKRVRIALEAGPIAPETERRYVKVPRGAPGDLMLVRMDDATLVVLLRKPAAPAAPPSAAPRETALFRLMSSTVLDGSSTTFHAKRDELLRLLPSLERDFSAWDGFGGIALHEFR